MNPNKFLRRCASCRSIKSKEELVRITKDYKTGEVKINTDGSIQGRSVYLCKNLQCVEKALKKNKLEVLLKSKLPEDVKLALYTVLKN